ncbi:MAG: glycosyltransferase family 9 protein [Bacteroidia bacterium]|nr:glycosyltransferase family 9 protein [Bacteroidia bacterium]NND26547.1 glycosyltransferase family 9 protein [Flavobacteriaceae bacterium]MBT8278357.1 glycosyltransferase family 9 protein [Bacteroidia bacterium]NNK60104.1 glycosyltransferase family 9 protein [Flavobacteriaceae bacterium]NNL32149.1 glycosyltransferase family 9 protein [Flavobacteriaceae bacterium]
MKILIIQQKMIGDVLTSSILLEALKSSYPNAELHYVINSNTLPVVINNPYLDKIIEVTPEIEKSRLKFFNFLKDIRKEKYDAVIDVYGKLGSLLISIFAKSKIKVSYHKSHTSAFFTHTIKRLKQPQHHASLAIENRLKLLEPLNIPFKNYSPKIYLKSNEIEVSKQFLESSNIDLNKDLYMISVLGSDRSKTYPFDYMARLLDEIVSVTRGQILFNYIPKQEEDAKTIYNHCNSVTQKHIFFDVYGKSLRSFLAITSHCTALIGNEGGANNMAKALNIPTFTIFSPYLNKQNWFSESEKGNNVAVHLSDYIDYSATDKVNAKKDPQTFYLKLKPELIIPDLKNFLSTLVS